jgi:hypothetical protein
MEKVKDLVLYRDHCQLLSITMPRDPFNVKKHSGLYLDSKVVTSRSYPFLR